MLRISLQRFAQHDKKSVSFFGVANWICDSRFAETFQSQETGIAFAAGETFWCRIVTTVRERKVDAEFDYFPNDFGFGQFDQRRVNSEPSAFDTGFGPDIGQVLEGFDKFRSAVGVAAVVDRVDTEKNV